MRKTVLFFVLFIGIYTKMFGQKHLVDSNVYGGYLIIPIEFPIIDTRALNEQLTTNGLPAANYSPANLGIGFQLFTERVITTFSFNKLKKKVNQDNYLVEVEYRSTAINLGYNLIKRESYSIYPYAGLKGSGLNYLYRDKAQDTSSFVNYLNTNLKYKEFSNSRTHLDFGFGASLNWFFIFNLRVGFLLPIEKVKWEINDYKTTLPNAPNIRYNCYFSLTIGIGKIESDNDRRRFERRPFLEQKDKQIDI